MKKWLCLILLLSLTASLCACGKPQESSAALPPESSSESPATQPAATENPTEAPMTEAPTLPPEPEALLSREGKTLYAYGQKWAEARFDTVEFGLTGEEDLGSVSLRLELERISESNRLTLSGSVVMGTGAAALFDLPEEAEEDPSAEGFLKELILQSLQQAEPGAALSEQTIGGRIWNVGFARQQDSEGLNVLTLYAWNEAEEGICFVNLSAVLWGPQETDREMQTVRTQMEEWLSSLEIR